jgi:hypothetical protein
MHRIVTVAVHGRRTPILQKYKGGEHTFFADYVDLTKSKSIQQKQQLLNNRFNMVVWSQLSYIPRASVSLEALSQYRLRHRTPITLKGYHCLICLLL